MSAPPRGGTASTVLSGFVILALCAYFGYHIAYVRPGKAVEQIQQQLTEARQKHELQQVVVSSLYALEQQRTRFAERPDPDWLLQEISQLTTVAGLEARAVSPHPALTRGDVTVLRVSLQFRATYHELGRFLGRIESHPRFLQVDDLQLIAQSAESRHADVRLTLSTVYVPPELIVGFPPASHVMARAHEEAF